MSFVLDWLFGDNRWQIDPPRWLSRHESEIGQTPILRLNSAIIQQAIADQASRIDFWVGIPELDYHSVESPKQYEYRIESEANEQTNCNKDFSRMMAEEGIQAPGDTPAEEKLSVFFSYGEFKFCVMTIPANLVGPCIRAYPFSFNHNLCATTSKPENLIYVSTKQRAAFASIDHFDRLCEHKLGVCLEYEDTKP